MAEQFAHDRPARRVSGSTSSGTLRNCFRVDEEVRMGDRGGKKAKEKNQQQQINKQKEKQQKKDDKAAPRAPLPASH
jgi:hypothetical protein